MKRRNLQQDAFAELNDRKVPVAVPPLSSRAVYDRHASGLAIATSVLVILLSIYDSIAV